MRLLKRKSSIFPSQLKPAFASSAFRCGAQLSQEQYNTMKFVYREVCEKEKKFLDEIQDVGDNAVENVADLRLIPELLAQLHVPSAGEQNINQLIFEIKRAIRELGAEAKVVKLRYVYDLYADFQASAARSMDAGPRKGSANDGRNNTVRPDGVGIGSIDSEEGNDNHNGDDEDAYYAEQIGSEGIVPTEKNLLKIRPKLSRFPAIINVGKKATKFPFKPQPVIQSLMERNEADTKASNFRYELTEGDLEKINAWMEIRRKRKQAAAYIARKRAEKERTQIGGPRYHDIRREVENQPLPKFGHEVKLLEGSGDNAVVFI